MADRDFVAEGIDRYRTITCKRVLEFPAPYGLPKGATWGDYLDSRYPAGTEDRAYMDAKKIIESTRDIMFEAGLPREKWVRAPEILKRLAATD